MKKETNLEHYKERLQTLIGERYKEPSLIFHNIQAFMDPEIKSTSDAYTDDILEWMAQQYREPLLNPEEKKYLSEVIRPFRKEVLFIKKLETPSGKEYILIILKDDGMHFPSFEKGKMYKGMEPKKRYTPRRTGALREKGEQYEREKIICRMRQMPYSNHSEAGYRRRKNTECRQLDGPLRRPAGRMGKNKDHRDLCPDCAKKFEQTMKSFYGEHR